MNGRGIYLALVLSTLLTDIANAQLQPLPTFVIDRRENAAYMDSLSFLAKRQYQLALKLPRTASNDTTKFQTLYYLGRLYSWWHSRVDSTLYFADDLIKQAHERHNVAFEVKGILLNEFYYRDLKPNHPQALQLNFQARSILQKTGQDPMVGWRIDLNLGQLYTVSGDYENALRFLHNAQTLITKGSGVSPPTTIAYQADIELKLGGIYGRQLNYPESEKHYLAAERVLGDKGSKTNYGFIYEVLSSL